MADQNVSDKKKMNTAEDDIDASSVMSELERIGMRAGRKSANRIKMDEKLTATKTKLNSLYGEAEKQPSLRDHPVYMESVPALKAEISKTRTRMNSHDSAAVTRAESEASTYITRQFSTPALNSRISSMQQESSVQNAAFSMSNQSYDQLLGRREDIHSNLRMRERHAQNEVKGLFEKGGRVSPEQSADIGMKVAGGETHENLRELATINAASAIQRASGRDPNSKLRNLTEMSQKASSIMGAEAIGKEVQSGGINISSGGADKRIANSDVNKEVVNQARILSEAFTKLTTGALGAGETLDTVRSSAEEAAENMKKLQDGQAAGAGGNGNSNRMQNASAVASAFAGGFHAIGGAAQQVLINQRMQETGNIGGFANLANQQYDMYAKARGGDVASQMAMSQWGVADDLGTEMKNATHIVQGAGALGASAQTAAGGFKLASTINPVDNFINTAGVMDTRISGGMDMVQGMSQGLVIASDVEKETSAQSNRLGGIQAHMDAKMAINKVGASQAQGLRNFMTDMDVAGQEMGGQGTAYLKSATSDANLSKMSEARISPEQFAKMSQLGASQMGSMFSGDQIYGARNLEKSGFGNMQTNMGRMAQLAGAGSNNPQAGMESVMAAAMTKGLDSSKAIGDMVSNTAAMVSVSSGAQVGIDTTGAASTMLAAQIDPNIANKEFAVNRAATAQQIATGLTTNDSVSFSGMVNTARISKETGLGGTEAIMAQKLDTATLRSMMGMSDKKRKEALLNKGINSENSTAGSSKELVQKLLDADEREILEGGGSAFGVGMDVNKIQAKMKKGIKLSPNEQAQVSQAAIGAGFSGGNEMRNSMKAVSATNSEAGTKEANQAMSGTGIDEFKKQLDVLRTGGFQQLTDAARTASKQLEDFGGAMEVFTTLQNKYEKDGMGSEKEFSTAGSKFAETFGASTGIFEKSVGKFENAIKALSDKAGLTSNRNPLIPEDFNKNLDKIKGILK